MIFLSRFGEPQPVPIPPIENGRHYLMAIASMALAPAVLEEFMFRGVIQRGYEGYGRAVSIILTGIMFAFLHLSVVTIPAIIFMGILLCYIAYRADSVWASIAYHFTNNMIAITIAYVSSLISNMLPGGIFRECRLHWLIFRLISLEWQLLHGHLSVSLP